MHRRATYKRNTRTPLITLSRNNVTTPAPLMGGGGIPSDTREGELAAWVKPEHRTPLLLALSLYNQPIQTMSGYVLHAISSDRVGCWYRAETDTWVIGCKGTDFFSSSGASDILDDKQIAFGSYCDLSLVQEATLKIQWLLEQEVDVEDMIIAGHSLGGTAAVCIAAKFGMECISFNGGASPTNPVTGGPGPQIATHYHIVGDLISSHMSNAAARVIRIRTPKSIFGSFEPHSSTRILASDGPWTYATADDEDEMYLAWAKQFKLGWGILSSLFTIGSYLAHLKKYEIAKKSPIPDSIRSISLRN